MPAKTLIALIVYLRKLKFWQMAEQPDPWELQTVTLQIRIPRHIKHQFQDWCDDQGLTMTAVLLAWILSQPDVPDSLRRIK